jgi:hypothetical protein
MSTRGKDGVQMTREEKRRNRIALRVHVIELNRVTNNVRTDYLGAKYDQLSEERTFHLRKKQNRKRKPRLIMLNVGKELRQRRKGLKG